MNWFSHWDEWIESTEENNKNNILSDDDFEYDSIAEDDINKLFEN